MFFFNLILKYLQSLINNTYQTSLCEDKNIYLRSKLQFIKIISFLIKIEVHGSNYHFVYFCSLEYISIQKLDVHCHLLNALNQKLEPREQNGLQLLLNKAQLKIFYFQKLYEYIRQLAEQTESSPNLTLSRTPKSNLTPGTQSPSRSTGCTWMRSITRSRWSSGRRGSWVMRRRNAPHICSSRLEPDREIAQVSVL